MLGYNIKSGQNPEWELKVGIKDPDIPPRRSPEGGDTPPPTGPPCPPSPLRPTPGADPTQPHPREQCWNRNRHITHPPNLRRSEQCCRSRGGHSLGAKLATHDRKPSAGATLLPACVVPTLLCVVWGRTFSTPLWVVWGSKFSTLLWVCGLWWCEGVHFQLCFCRDCERHGARRDVCPDLLFRA